MRRWNEPAPCWKAICWAVLVTLATCVTTGGCSRRTEELPTKVLPAQAGAQVSAGPSAVPLQAQAPEPFDPPALDVLDREAGWIDRPVRDGLTILREQQGREQSAATAVEGNPGAAVPPVLEEAGALARFAELADLEATAEHPSPWPPRP